MPRSKAAKRLQGSNYSDSLTFDAGTNNLVRNAYGLGGDDSFSTRGAVSFKLSLYGGEGNDNFDSGSEVSDFNGKKGAFQKNALRLYGESGDDTLSDSLGGTHILSGGDGDDRVKYHTNTGRYYGYTKPDLLIDGGNGNDKISYFNFPLAKGIVRGGDGDDLIGIGGKSGGGGIKYYGEGGDDVFSLRMLPEEHSTYIDGGDGFDELYLTYDLSARLVRTDDYGGKKDLVFAFWQKNGVTVETVVSLSGIEYVGSAGDFVPYKWGNDVNGSTSVLSDYWATNGGFS